MRVRGGAVVESSEDRITQPTMLARTEEIQKQIQQLSGRDLEAVHGAGDREAPRGRLSPTREVADVEAVPLDRGGISQSIVGRMTRAGGRAGVRSVSDEGTEVELVLPLAKVGEPS